MAYDWLTVFGFTLVSFLLGNGVYHIIVVIKRHNIPAQKERQKLMFVVFFLTYASRVAWEGYEMYLHNHYDELDQAQIDRWNAWQNFLPSIWDCLPIGLLEYYHFKSFRANEQKSLDDKDDSIRNDHHHSYAISSDSDSESGDSS